MFQAESYEPIKKMYLSDFVLSHHPSRPTWLSDAALDPCGHTEPDKGGVQKRGSETQQVFPSLTATTETKGSDTTCW